MRKLVCFGDNITAQNAGHMTPRLTSLLQQHLSEWFVLNEGVSGNTTRDALARIESDVLGQEPDLVTVLFGTNDVEEHNKVTIEEYEENIRKIVSFIGPDKTILLTPPPIDEVLQTVRKNEVIGRYARAVELVACQKGAYVIPLFDLMIHESNYREMLKKDDGLHFSELGYTFLSKQILKTIQEKIH
ncbi:GDSL-type esterase/lipase family protein [Halobacillus shinanisalinarum]|uniref:GDSL-type esterase/lipase family protein n=1 Tax=Halobacillus shinanisalinarum TaxID=2932258 RepID=A0ABY4GUJ0_9BACI|nr:GDSL-type esterase/lipase family protein [Halobacillus shinanisalinarum]UOQ91689.1 GDSL-type esterase/lipase family protein [Halobacillus shinanisalinarum]